MVRKSGLLAGYFMPKNAENKRTSHQLSLPLDIGQLTPVWRPIHYLGSKLRLVDSIRELIADLDPNSGPVCDLFAGSGTVSLALSGERRIVAADIQEYSRVLCTALLNPAFWDDTAEGHLFKQIEISRIDLEKCLAPILEYEQRAIECAATKPTLLCDLVERGSLLSFPAGQDSLAKALRQTKSLVDKSANSFLASRYFGGSYFSFMQTLYIDGVFDAIDRLPANQRTTCLAALLSTASSMVNSVGKQFAQPMRPRRSDGTIKQHLIKQMCRDRTLDPGKTFSGWLSQYRSLQQGTSHRVIRGDYREVLAQLRDVAVIYADPPYTRDHYSRFYHVLETLCLRDCPDISTTFPAGEGGISRGLYRSDRHQSPFCIKSQAPSAFIELFKGARKLDIPLLVSYSPFIKDGHPRLMTVEAVSKLASDHYRCVDVVPARPIMHSKLNKSELHLEAACDAEVFIVCRT